MCYSYLMSSDLSNEQYRILLESTKVIPWKINWITKQFDYIGPQIEDLLGWSQESWKDAGDWAARIHADDRENIVNYCVGQSDAGIDHEADYRALTNNGDYVWIRDLVHVIRNQGVVESLVGFRFDITERKQAEEELARLNKELVSLSFGDSLTGISNRRMFDQTLAKEWRRGQRSQQPLSLIMLDIDYFKQYNDQHGHQKGDDCLKTVSKVLSTISRRSSDLIARYGGDELVILLPETPADEACLLAQECLRIVSELKIPHGLSIASDVLTTSVGVSTFIPSDDSNPSVLVEAADRLLYQAKENGRNRVEYE